MNSSSDPGANDPAPIRWYARSSIDEFLAEADAEQARLEALIADANTRLARTRVSSGVHQTMLEMLVEAQRDVRAIRWHAQAQVESILSSADRSQPPFRAQDHEKASDNDFFRHLHATSSEEAQLGSRPR